MTHASVAEEKFNVEKIQDRACFVKGEDLKSGICQGRQVEELSSIVMVGKDHPTPPNVNGVIGKEITTGRYVRSQTGEAVKADSPYEKAVKMTAIQQNNTTGNDKGGDQS